MSSFVRDGRPVAHLFRPPAHKRRLCRLLLGASLCIGATSAAAQSMRDAVDAAWARSVQGRSADARVLETKAKVDAAGRWLAEPPSVTVSHRSDRLNRNTGAQELEAEVALPIRTPGVRDADIAVATNEASATGSSVRAAKWRLAGEVREALWAHRFAALELTLAKQRATDAEALARDVERRVTAGESARVDANRANNERDLGLLAVAEAEQRALHSANAVTLLTGLKVGEMIEEVSDGSVWKDDAKSAHPMVVAQRAVATAANARRQQAVTSTREPLEFSIGTARERDRFGEASKGSARIGIRIPFATTARNAPRVAEASAVRIEADTALQLAAEQIDAEVRVAEAALAQVSMLIPIAERRATAARDTATLLAKSYQLGETDLPTRLRAEAERFDAERVAERTKLERARAISRLNQAKGLLP